MNEFLLRCNGIGTRTSLFFIGFLLVFSGWAQTETTEPVEPVAKVITDLDDYPPGATAIINGTGFKDSEVVELHVHHADGDPMGTDPDYHQPWTVTADSEGNFTTSWYVPTQEEGDAAGATLLLQAHGNMGSLADWTFTDSVTTVTINSPTTASPISVPAGCDVNIDYSYSASSSGSNGTTTISVKSGTTVIVSGTQSAPKNGNYNFSINLTIPASTTSGNYAIEVSVTQGATVVATQTNAITVNTVAAIMGGSPTVCVGATTPAFTNATAGGTWSVTQGTGTASISLGGVLTGITAGIVTVNYTIAANGNGCTNKATKTVTVNPKPTVSKTQTDVLCNGASTGAIDITAGGGTATYTYAWTTSDGSGLVATDEDQSGLTEGTYKVIVTDANSCVSEELEVTITENSAVTVALTSQTNVLCNGASTGAIDITAGGGTATYTYAWTTSDGSGLVVADEDQTGLAAGTYTLTVTDAKGCTDSSLSVTITEPDAIVLVVNGELLSCNGDSDGNITGSVSGGTFPYTVKLSGAATASQTVATDGGTYDFSGLSAGSYTVTVEDDNYTAAGGCTATDDAAITEPDALSVVLDSNNPVNVSCNGGSDGTIDITVSGGTEGTGYTYLWATTDGSGLVVADEDQTSLTVGTYTLTVTDGNGCTVSLSEPVTISEPDAIVLVVNGELLSCNGDLDGSISGSISGGTALYTLILSDSSGDLETKTNVPAGDYIFNNYGAGSYTVTVQDFNYTALGGSGCSSSDNADITEPDALAVELDSNNPVNVSCNGVSDGTIDITVSGGTEGTGYTYLWATTDGSGLVVADEDQTGLAAGTYTLTVTDAKGCTDSSLSVTITEPDAIVLVVNGELLSCNGDSDGNITGSVSGGTFPYTVKLSGAATASQTVATDGGTYDFSGLSAGSYTVTVEDDNFTAAGGCTATDDAAITEPDANSIITMSDPQNVNSQIILKAVVSPIEENRLVTFYLNGTQVKDYNTSDFEVYTNHLGVAEMNIGMKDANVYVVKSVLGSNCANSEVYLPVYDPNGGFVTGGGWINSPEVENPTDSRYTYMQEGGKANFGFVAKYKSGKNTMGEVDGNTNFQFKEGNFHFKSSIHEKMMLIISGAKATYEGTGTVNGVGSHKFMVVVQDGDLLGNNAKDMFRIKVWKTNDKNSDVIYDNLTEITPSMNHGSELGGGSIVIHKPKPNSKTQEVLTKGTPIIMEDLRPEILETLAASPNPVVSSSTVRFSVKVDAIVTLRLFDHSGRMIETLFQGNVKAFENYDVDFQRRNLMSGIYIVKLTTAQGHSYEKRIIIN